jgi:hypothetical protein
MYACDEPRSPTQSYYFRTQQLLLSECAGYDCYFTSTSYPRFKIYSAVVTGLQRDCTCLSAQKYWCHFCSKFINFSEHSSYIYHYEALECSTYVWHLATRFRTFIIFNFVCACVRVRPSMRTWNQWPFIRINLYDELTLLILKASISDSRK